MKTTIFQSVIDLPADPEFRSTTLTANVPPEAEPLSAVLDMPGGAMVPNAPYMRTRISVYWRVRSDRHVQGEMRKLFVTRAGEPLPTDEPYGYLSSVSYSGTPTLHVFTDMTHRTR